MIGVLALILSVLGTALLMMQSEKLRLGGFLLWIVGNVCWVSYGWWVVSSWEIIVWFSLWQILCVSGAVGCYGKIKKEADPIP